MCTPIITKLCQSTGGGAGAGGMPGGMPGGFPGGAPSWGDTGSSGGPAIEEVD